MAEASSHILAGAENEHTGTIRHHAAHTSRHDASENASQAHLSHQLPPRSQRDALLVRGLYLRLERFKWPNYPPGQRGANTALDEGPVQWRIDNLWEISHSTGVGNRSSEQHTHIKKTQTSSGLILKKMGSGTLVGWDSGIRATRLWDSVLLISEEVKK